MPLKIVPAMLRRVTPAWWLALIGPLLLINFPALPFANHGCDSGYVFGLFHNLPEYVQKVGWARQTGRFATNLPGFLVTHIFDGIAADYAWFLLIYTLAVIFFFKAASSLLSPRGALLASLFFALSPFVVGNYSWVLSTAPALTYEAIALFCAMRAVEAAAQSKRLSWMFISGFGWGAAINAHLSASLFGTFIYFFFALCVLFEIESTLGERIKLIILSALSVVAGVVIFHVGVGLIAVVLFHAPYSLVLRQVLYMPTAMESVADHFFDLDKHLRGARVGAFLLGVVPATTAAINYGHRMASRIELTVSQRRRFAIALAFLLTFACLLAHEIVFRGIFLQYSAYYVLLWPCLALAIFAVAFDWDRISIPVLLLFFVLCFIGLSSRIFSEDVDAMRDGSLAIALAAGILAIAFLNVKTRRHADADRVRFRHNIVRHYVLLAIGGGTPNPLGRPATRGDLCKPVSACPLRSLFSEQGPGRPSCAPVSEVLEQ